MKILLWLDDLRDPFKEKKWLVFSPIEEPYGVVWVKDYNSFVRWIERHGLPEGICFDHDLADEHIYYFHKNGSHAAPPIYENYDLFNEKTGYHCAKWLVEYCMDNNVPLPKWNIHSANPVGKENIKMLLENYDKRRNSINNKGNE